MTKIALWIGMATLAFAQTPDSAGKIEFEVASIHPANQDDNHDLDIDNSLFRAHNLTLKRLIGFAYEIDIAQIYGGPNWVDSDSYDINARLPEEFVGKKKTPQMMQSLLAERFQLVMHREPRQISGYALVVSKTGPKMKRAKPDQKDSTAHSNNGHLTAQNVTMEAFAKYFSRNRDVGKLVVDKTGLTGGFDFELHWMPEQLKSQAEPSADDLPSIFTAIQEQLGLKLESAKIPIEVVVIDRAEKPEAN